MGKDRLYVGLDTDKRFVDVAIAEGQLGGEVRYWGQIANDPASIDRKETRRSRVGEHDGPGGVLADDVLYDGAVRWDQLANLRE